MTEVGIRALKQNASAVVAEAASGRVVTITDRGRPVAQLTPIPSSPLQQLLESGRARDARRRPSEIPMPQPGPPLSQAVIDARSDERY